MSTANPAAATIAADRYGSLEEQQQQQQQLPTQPPHAENSGGGAATAAYVLHADDAMHGEKDGLMREKDGLMRDMGYNNHHRDSDEDDDDEDNDDDEFTMSLQELLYSSSSYYAIAKPVTITMILAALAVIYINTDETRAEGEQAMASAYQVWNIDSASSSGQTLALSFANALVMVSVICGMTFVIVMLYRLRCMLCLLGYMMLCSGTLLGVLGGNLLSTAVYIYKIPIDKISFSLFIYNFAIVGVVSVFWGKGVPKFITQAYLIATSVILAWHVSFFDEWTTWTLLTMLALYDLCAVLTPCGPLKALVDLMSQDDAPEMPGLLFEADLPPEAKRPGVPRTSTGLSQSSSRSRSRHTTRPESTSPTSENPVVPPEDRAPGAEVGSGASGSGSGAVEQSKDEGPLVNIPLAIAKVYNLPVMEIPDYSLQTLFPQRYNSSNVSASPLLQDGPSDCSVSNLPENPTPTQLRAMVTVRLPLHGGRIEQVLRRGKRVYLERDRHGKPKRILWVDRSGKVFAEMRTDDEDGPERNSIRLGLGDFIFYSVLVAKAAQYSFATFVACMLVILAGLGGTLVLLSVYHHALPALPISIFLGVVFYLVTRVFIEPWIEFVLSQPYYV